MTGESQQPDPAADLDLLFPDREVTVADPETEIPVDLTVREFRFREGLEAQALARPLIDALAEIIEGDDEIGAEAIAGALAEHADTWLELIARASGVPPGWLASLADADGDALSEAMWDANRAFFTRRAVAAVTARVKKRMAAAAESPSPKSSTASSAPDTGADTGT